MGNGMCGGKGDVTTIEEIVHLDLGGGFIGGEQEWERLSEDLYSVLLDRTDGELHRKVVNAGARADAKGRKDAGGMAYIQVYAWFMESTGLKMSERRGAWMNPQPVKHEYEVADAIEAWE